MNSFIRAAIQQLSPYVCARDLYKKADVFLDANENAFGSAIDYDGVELNRYPDSDATQLRQAIATYAGVSDRQILVGNGSDEIIALTLMAIAEKGDNIITIQPGYSMYGVCAQTLGAEERAVCLDGEFRVDANAVLQKTDAKTKGIFFPSPNSATGSPVEESTIRKVLEEFNGLVFVDEAYFEFYGKTSVPLVETYPNLIVSRTFSKAWGLAALRVGYAIANPELIKTLRKVKPPYNVGTVSQNLVLKAIQTGQTQMLENVEKIRNERVRLSKELQKLGVTVYPSVLNFVLVRFDKKQDSKKIQQELALRGIIVRDRSSLPLLDSCIRITIGTPNENNRLLAELSQILGGRRP